MTTMTFQPQPLVSPPRPWTFPHSRTGGLVDGLTVTTCHLPSRRIAAVELVLDAGAELDPAGLDGLAALTARALREGTSTLDAAEFAAALEGNGASLSTAAGVDGMRVSLVVPVTRLAAALRLLADAVIRPALIEGEVGRLVASRLDEITHEQARPQTMAAKTFAGAVFTAESRVSRPAGGTGETVAPIDRAAVADFHRSHVQRAAATLVVAADLSGIDIDAVITEAFAEWPANRIGRRSADEPVARAGGKVIVVDRPGSVQTQFAIGHSAVGRAYPERPALLVAAHALGGSPTSRLDAVLREVKGYTYGFRSYFAAYRRGGAFVISGSVHTEVTAPAVADTLEVLNGVVDGGITEAERDAAVEYLAGAAPTLYDTAMSIANELADGVRFDLPAGHVDAHLAAVRATTTDGASQAFRRIVDPERLTVVAVGDAERIVSDLTDVGHGSLEVIS